METTARLLFRHDTREQDGVKCVGGPRGGAEHDARGEATGQPRRPASHSTQQKMFASSAAFAALWRGLADPAAQPRLPRGAVAEARSPGALVGARRPLPAGGVEGMMEVIVTTSPVQSNPSTAMIEMLFRSFDRVSGLAGCRKLLVCDGITDAPSTQYRKGRVTAEAAAKYGEYVERVRPGPRAACARGLRSPGRPAVAAGCAGRGGVSEHSGTEAEPPLRVWARGARGTRSVPSWRPPAVARPA